MTTDLLIAGLSLLAALILTLLGQAVLNWGAKSEMERHMKVWEGMPNAHLRRRQEELDKDAHEAS